MKESTKMVMVLVIVSLLSATSLSIVYERTKQTIEENKAEELQRSLNEVIPKAYRFKEDSEAKEIISEEREGIKKVFDAYDKNDEKTGIVLLMDSIGFGGTIKILVGVDTNTAKIAGMKILEHLETPGLGERITEPEFLNQFKDKSTEIKADEFDAITGATISSTAVIETITENVNKISGYIEKPEDELIVSVMNESLENSTIENAST